MKKVFSIIALALISASVGYTQPKGGFKVKFDIKNYVKDTINLVYFSDNNLVRHSIAIKDNKGEITINAPKYTSVNIITRDPKNNIPVERGIIPGPSITFISEGDKDISIAMDYGKWPECDLKGGTINNDYNRLYEKTMPLKREEFDLQRKRYGATTSDSEKKSIEEKIIAIKKNIAETEQQFVVDNSSSYIALNLLAGQRNSFDLEEYDRRFNLLSKELKVLPTAVEIANYITTKKATAIGSKAPLFEKKDKDGKTIKLANYSGKYLLIDFWGTWCGPCRSSHPHLVSLYNKYNKEGLEFINVAQENTTKREKWLQAINEDKLSWTQILNDEDKDVYDMVKAFAITAFPTKVLISPDGTIVGTYVGDSEDIDKKLVEIFKK